MAPEPRGSWHDGMVNELFGSLFGGSGIGGVLTEAVASNGALDASNWGQIEIPTDGLKLFEKQDFLKKSTKMQAQQELLQILDAIETGKYKSAFTLATKASKKYKDLTVLKAMLAYAADRTGRSFEALTLCSELLAVRPAITDDLTLQLVSQILRFNKKPKDIITLYANATNAAPQNLEYANHYFMALVRAGDDQLFKTMQQVALKMQKTFKDSKYFFWAVTAIYLQGVSAASTGSTNIFFTLAEKMLEKAVLEKKFTNFE
ncbi:N-alpha-acetyltransferase 25, NatB auxiliary subunit, partial [Physocladia obscura]